VGRFFAKKTTFIKKKQRFLSNFIII